MKNLIISLIQKIVALGNGYLTPMTDHILIRRLICKLAPMNYSERGCLIRLGPKGDGGYLVPNDLDGIEACFSPGVCEMSGFEKDCAELGMKIFMADRSVNQQAESHVLFHFTKKYVGVTTNDDFMTLDDWVTSSLPLGSTSDLILQIDVEGFEYEVFMNMPDSLMRRFRIILVEFHNLEQLWNRPFFQIGSRAFEKIIQTHTCVHIHPNNCVAPLDKGGLSIPPTAEFTFLRTDRVENATRAKVFPHPLDFDNANKPHFALPDCFYQEADTGVH